MKNNTYYDNILRKVLTETLEDRADEIMEKLKFNKPGSSFDYVEEGETCEQCGLGEMVEGKCSECGSSKGEVMEYSFKDELENNFSSYEEFCSQYYNMDDPRCQGYYHYTSKLDDESGKENSDESGEEIKERLYGNQRRIDKNKNGRIDREDFKMLRSRSEMKENSEETKKREKQEKGTEEKRRKKDNPFKTDPDIKERTKANSEETKKREKQEKETEEKRRKKDNPFKTDPDIKERTKAKTKVKESVFYKLEYINESALFTEEEIIDIIEGIINEEDNIKKGKSPAGYAAYEKSHKGSGKEEDDYMKELSKKMIDYMKDGSKGKYDMNPKHFPKGNGELAKMDKKAYEIDQEGTDFNVEISGQMIPDYDGKPPKKETIEKQIKGSSTNGNDQNYGNAVKTGVNDKFAKYFEDDQLAKWKDESYGRVPSPVYGEKPLKNKGKAKLKEEFDRMKGLIGYDRKTQ
jgi:hypothetical protein